MFLGNNRPELKDINSYVVTKCATKWKHVGENLNIDEDLLNIIEEDNPNNCENCCSEVLSLWLDLNPNASWNILLDAVDKTRNTVKKVPDTAEKLDSAANKLPDTIEKLDSAANKLPDTVEKLDTAADKLPEVVERLGSATSQLCKSIDKLPKVTGKMQDINVDSSAGNMVANSYKNTFCN